MAATINWRQVLEIETYWARVYEQEPGLMTMIWRHPQEVNSKLRVDKLKRYGFDDVQEYLMSKYPKDEMIRSNTELTHKLFMLCAFGMQVCAVDEELLDINENHDAYRLSAEDIKINFLNQFAEEVGSVSFLMHCLKDVIDFERTQAPTSPDLSAKERIKSLFLDFLRRIRGFNTNKLVSPAGEYKSGLQCSEEVIATFEKLKDQVAKSMTRTTFRSYMRCCERNDYLPPYDSDNFVALFDDLLSHSVSEVVDIIMADNDHYFGFKLRKNESQFPESQRLSKDGNLNVFLSLNGLLNYDKVLQLKLSGELVAAVKEVLSSQFTILPWESINDDFDPDVTVSNNKLNSSLIVGKSVVQKRLYNQYVNEYHQKLMNGFFWFHNDVHPVPYDYLGYNKKEDYKGEYQFSVPFEAAISNFFIVYLEKTRWERELDENREDGYWLSKEEFESRSSGGKDEDDDDDEDEGDYLNRYFSDDDDDDTDDVEDDDEEDDDDDDYNFSASYCDVCDAGRGESCNMSDPQSCPYGRGIN